MSFCRAAGECRAAPGAGPGIGEPAERPGLAALRSCVGNASVRAIGNAVMIEKAEAGRAKIDPLIAVFNAAALMALNPKPRKKKYQAFFVG